MTNPSLWNRRRLLLAGIAGLIVGQQKIAHAGSHLSTHRCHACGCGQSCRKVCRLVCEEKKVTLTLWGYSEEDFCLGGPSSRGCEHEEWACGEELPAEPGSSEKTKPEESTKAKDASSQGSMPGSSTSSKSDDAKKKPHVFSQAKRWVWSHWTPSRCGDLHSRRKLMKKTVTKKVPSFKWVVEDLCPACIANQEPTKVAHNISIPEPPLIADAVILPIERTPEVTLAR